MNVVHRPAHVGAALILFTELDGKKDLGILGHHTQKGADPHPEYGTGATQNQGGGNTCDATRSDGSCEGGGNCLEGAYASLILLMEIFLKELSDGIFQNVAEASELKKAGSDGQKETCRNEENHHCDAQNIIVGKAEKIVQNGQDFFHTKPFNENRRFFQKTSVSQDKNTNFFGFSPDKAKTDTENSVSVLFGARDGT